MPKDGRLQEDDQIISISGTNLVGLSNRDALNIVRRLLAPDALKANGTISLVIGRLAESVVPLAPVVNKTPKSIKKSDSSRHNDSYIIATQHGKEKISLDPKMNRSQSLKALQYLNQQNCEDSVIYKDYPLENDDSGDNTTGFDRESTSRQSFSEKRKQASSMSPPLTGKLIEYRSLNRKKNGHSTGQARRAVSLERRHSGGSTGIQSRSTEVTDSFSSTSQNSSQDNSRTYKDQIGRFSPAVNTRSTSLSPTKCSYGSLPRSSPSGVIIATQQQQQHRPQHHRPPQRGPMRSRSSDRVIPSRSKTQDNSIQKEPGLRGKSAERVPRHQEHPQEHPLTRKSSQLSEEDERKYDQIRARTLEYRRIRDSKVDFKKTPPIITHPTHHHHQPIIGRPSGGGEPANQRRGSFGTTVRASNSHHPPSNHHTDHLINNERFSSLSRITARRKYHSPGTVSCQDFAPTPIQIQTKPYFTPDSHTLPYKDRGMQSNRRLNYESNTQPQHHLSTPFISRSKNI